MSLTQTAGESARTDAQLAPSVCFILSPNVNCCVEQNPNVAFDFDHWEECEEDSHFSRGKTGAPTPWGAVGPGCRGAGVTSGGGLCGNGSSRRALRN